MKPNRLDAILAKVLSDKPEDSIQYTNLDYDEVRDLVKRNYSNAFEAARNDIFIFRGDAKAENNDVEYVLAKSGNRRSENTTNTYTKLISDVLPSWSAYPKRNKSFICSLNYDNAETYALHSPYLMFPKNNTKIGICCDNDLWSSFYIVNELCGNMGKFNFFLDLMFKLVCKPSIQIPDFINESADEIKSFLDEFDTALAEKENNKNGKTLAYEKIAAKDFVKTIVENVMAGGSTFDLLNDKILNPTVNTFNLVNDILEIDPNIFDNNEVWFSGECIMINNTLINDLMNI